MKTQINHSRTKEDRQHSSVLIPYSLYDCRIPELFANVPAHWHEETELNYIEAGTGHIFLDGESFPVKKGDLVIIPPNVLHAAFAAEDDILNYQAFVFHHSMLGTKSNDRSAINCIYPFVNGTLKLNYHFPDIEKNHKELYLSIKNILSATREDTPLSDLLIKSSLIQLFYYMEKEPTFIQRSDSKLVNTSIIRPALTYMEEHFSEEITIEQLANFCSLSPSYFMSCFKKISGTTAIEHLTQLRIMSACDALINTSEPIASIAFQNGFDNLSNFNRQFKKLVGVTPNQFRKSI